MARPKKSSKTTATDVRFNDQLVLFRYFLNLFGKDTLKNLAGKLNDADYEGYDENQNTYFYGYLKQYAAIHADKVSFQPISCAFTTRISAAMCVRLARSVAD